MAKFNRADQVSRGTTSPIATVPGATTLTHGGAAAHIRDVNSDLFLLAVANMVGEDTFYEAADDRDTRYRQLIALVAVTDPLWLFQMLRWLRTGANMRSASIVGAVEAVRAMIAAPGPSDWPAHSVPGFNDDRGICRALIDVVCQRADEPGELVAYWMSRYGRKLPMPVKRGLGDAVRRLYTEREMIKYDASGAVRFGDVIELVHPTPRDDRQSALFRHAIDRRHGRNNPIPDNLPVLQAAKTLTSLPVADRRAYVLDPSLVTSPGGLGGAGFTWERLAGWLHGPMDAAAWSAIAPTMSYMAILRNLRNFDQQGLPDDLADVLAAKIADPGEVAASRQFPYRFLSAFKAAPSLRWGHALEKALDHATRNIPALPGRTLVAVDVSGSMGRSVSERSTVTLADVGALFGVALAKAGHDVTLVGFATDVFVHTMQPGAAVLSEVARFCQSVGTIGYGTETSRAIRATYDGHDRVVVVTDGQCFSDRLGTVSGAVPPEVPMYAFNLGGYAPAMMETGRDNRHEFGGLTDATFKMLPLIERGRAGRWPWEE